MSQRWGNLFGIIKWPYYVLVLSFYDSSHVNDYGCAEVLTHSPWPSFQKMQYLYAQTYGDVGRADAISCQISMAEVNMTGPTSMPAGRAKDNVNPARHTLSHSLGQIHTHTQSP